MTSLKSWFPIPRNSPFSLANIPFGIITHARSPTHAHPAIAIGAHALDLSIFSTHSGFSALSPIQPHQSVFHAPTLNPFAALGRPLHDVVRKYIQSVFSESTPYPKVLKDNAELQKECLIPLEEVTCHVPMQIGDYTDFYAGVHHARTVGTLLRGPTNALQPNYIHLPVAYHGRSSTVVISGTPIHRPHGQILTSPPSSSSAPKPTLSPSAKLDFELELGFFLCRSSALSSPIPIAQAPSYLFGAVLLNDWSARDVQAWEYVPLGPFTAKNFATTISPWIVLADALEPFLARNIPNETGVLPYLREESEAKTGYDIRLLVTLRSSSGKEKEIARTSSSNLLWSFPQMLAHHSITGCAMNVGDLLGSGTISGTEKGSKGALIEETENGKVPLDLDGGEERLFLEDGDELVFHGVCGNDEDALVGFGECKGRVEPAVELKFQ